MLLSARLVLEMASTVSNDNDRSEKWHRPFRMATTVYEREICVGELDRRRVDRNSFILMFLTYNYCAK